MSGPQTWLEAVKVCNAVIAPFDLRGCFEPHLAGQAWDARTTDRIQYLRGVLAWEIRSALEPSATLDRRVCDLMRAQAYLVQLQDHTRFQRKADLPETHWADLANALTIASSHVCDAIRASTGPGKRKR